MNKHRQQQKCRNKIKHQSADHAAIALKKINNAGLISYYCKQCGKWHLGNKSTKKLVRLNQLFDRLQKGSKSHD